MNLEKDKQGESYPTRQTLVIAELKTQWRRMNEELDYKKMQLHDLVTKVHQEEVKSTQATDRENRMRVELLRCQKDVTEASHLKEEVQKLRSEVVVLKSELEKSSPPGWWCALGEDNARLAEENVNLSRHLERFVNPKNKGQEKAINTIISTPDLYDPSYEAERSAYVEGWDEWALDPTSRELKVGHWKTMGGNQAYEMKRNERAALLAMKLGIGQVVYEKPPRADEEKAGAEEEEAPYVMKNALNLASVHSTGLGNIYIGDFVAMLSPEEVRQTASEIYADFLAGNGSLVDTKEGLDGEEMEALLAEVKMRNMSSSLILTLSVTLIRGHRELCLAWGHF